MYMHIKTFNHIIVKGGTVRKYIIVGSILLPISQVK